ncbi:sensor histidine kinase [Cesiribacter sp. SM1]|uniref:sensor histidine kinase n=1 Tax=Cesiribacter sp. SM1 TaxID=2861196 RepID=UPI001CD3E5AF|nr:histidine kinase [Cesiribacter sp. SM1]
MKKQRIIKIIFHLIVMAVMTVPPLFFFDQPGESRPFLNSAFYSSLVVLPFYILNVFILVPRYLKKGQYLKYAMAVVVIMAVVHVANKAIRSEVLPPLPPVQAQQLSEGSQLSGRLPLRRPPAFPFHLFPFLMALALGSSFEIILDQEKEKRLYEEGQKEKMIAELAFLKSQINPHFLFNTINNIYSLAAAKSDQTENAILLLSDMMRYVLYDSNVEKTSLKKEVEFIENFISLQKLRFSASRNVSINFEVGGGVDQVMIEPMLLLPFVENAFIHGISYKRDSFIQIELLVKEQNMYFAVANSLPEQTQKPGLRSDPKQDSGIGLANTYKRLQLLYPQKHTLEVERNEEAYKVALTINLS